MGTRPRDTLAIFSGVDCELDLFSRQRHLAPLFHQGEIKGRAHRLPGAEQPHQASVTKQLIAIATDFLVQELLQADFALGFRDNKPLRRELPAYSQDAWE